MDCSRGAAALAEVPGRIEASNSSETSRVIDRVEGEQLQRQLGEGFKEARHDDRGPEISLP